MALVNCTECGKQISDQAVACPHCGSPMNNKTNGQQSINNQSFNPQIVKVKPAKSRGVYIILGLFFGLLGVHNFYAGRLGVGFAQLLITLLLGIVVIGFVITGIWVIFELFTVTKDGAGDAFV